MSEPKATLRNAKPKDVYVGTFQRSVTLSRNVPPSETIQNSVTLAEAWDGLLAEYYRHGHDNVPVSCICCRRELLRRSFDGGHHATQCEAAWEWNQASCRHDHERRRRCTFEDACITCGRLVYSRRRYRYRVCFRCAHKTVRLAVKRWQAAHKVTHGSRACDHCGVFYQPKRATSRYCSVQCRVTAHRKESQ